MKNQIVDNSQCCDNCGSTEVARCKWVNVNNDEIYNADSGTSLEWCFECKNETKIIELSEYKPPLSDEVVMEECIENYLLNMFTQIGMDRPDNFDEMIGYIRRDIEETADPVSWNSEDIVIGFRRFIQSI